MHARGRQHRGGERTIEADMNYHLSKPIEAELLHKVLAQHIHVS